LCIKLVINSNMQFKEFLDDYYLRVDIRVFLPHKFWSSFKTSGFAYDKV
jgi:hypothetical protein